MTMIRTLKQLTAAAKIAGYKVNDTAAMKSVIKNKNTGIYWYEDGSIYMCGVQLHVARQMRVKDAVSFLGLK
jgi:hypothetical protein